MVNLPNCSPSGGRGEWMSVPLETVQRLELLVRLMVSLRGLGRGSVLYLDGRSEPVLSVPVVSRRRSMAVLVVQDGAGGRTCGTPLTGQPAGSVRVAAELIAGVTR